MRDNILESIFFDMDLWSDAIDRGVEKRISGYCLENITDPHYRADLCIFIGEGRYEIKHPHTGYCKKDDGSERMFLANDPQDRILLNVIYKWLMRNESKMIHPTCKSYQNGIGIGKIVKEIAHRINSQPQSKVDEIVGRKFDIHKYFESIERDKIHQTLNRVEKDFGDSSIIDLLHSYYDSDIYYDSRKGRLVSAYQGIKQGCAVSSWLANVLLFSLDEELSKRGGLYVRYSDDILYIGEDYEEVTKIISSRLSQMGLKLNAKKITNIMADEYFSFLGYDICGSEITLSRKWVKNFQREIDKRTIKNVKLIKQVRKIHKVTDGQEEKFDNLIDRAIKDVCRYLYYGNGKYSWATEVLPVITNESDLLQLTLYCIDAIKAVYTGHTNIGGLGKSLKQGIQRGKGRHVKSNILSTKHLSSAAIIDGQLTGFLSLLALKKAVANRWLFRTIAANLIDKQEHSKYGETKQTVINENERNKLFALLESLYSRYRESIPAGENVERFYAYSLDEMTPEMLIKGTGRTEALLELELFLTEQVDSSLFWSNNKEWYWQSQQFPELVLLRKWFK